MRIGIYARVSTQRQAQADGLTQQLERLQDLHRVLAVIGYPTRDDKPGHGLGRVIA